MGKKNRAPEPKESAFESAKAAFDRVGEDYIPASKAVELSKTEEPAEEVPEVSVDAAATPETPVDVPGTDDAEAVPGTDAPEPAEASDAESVESADSDANGVESADNAETPEVSEHEAVDSDVTPEVPVEGDTTPDADTAASETEEDSATPEPEAVEVADDAEEESDDFWTFAADEPESEEVTEMEKLTMETKEITLGVHRSPSVKVDTESREQEKKPKFYVKTFDRLKDALRTHADSTEHVEHMEHADESTASSGGSSRDAAIRKRVMQIEDEETRNYLLDRVLPQMTWYSKKSANYQKKYHQLMTAAICLGALIPVFSVWANNAAFKVILAFLGASVTAVNAYLALYKYQELWIAYRSAREELIHTLYSYFNKAGVFAQKKMTEKELNVLLVEVCENALSKENGGWTTTILQKTA